MEKVFLYFSSGGALLIPVKPSLATGLEKYVFLLINRINVFWLLYKLKKSEKMQKIVKWKLFTR